MVRKPADWIHDGRRSYSESRYDPADPTICHACGSNLVGRGDASTVGMHCPDCDVMVWVA